MVVEKPISYKEVKDTYLCFILHTLNEAENLILETSPSDLSNLSPADPTDKKWMLNNFWIPRVKHILAMSLL
ncbi:MAG: hypothetical protein KatS3mg095_0906 [Candidatus Parcubacteria bacterium]|nr:MAG: hypothetical protein KatS3mg095_0906 [Candidatus Parcubacteria bacterium]